ncbi:protein ARK2N isoform X2 [Centroberyx affinis]|uniref:protein ARK2N isoform X2 n=1 Tax=Centroberyx affinis TaxID=166261 RepID=UPI003A5C59A9
MKMADSEKAEEFVDAESLPECLADAESATASVKGEQDEHLKTETTTTTTSSPTRDKEADSPLHTEGEPGLLSMPCLMKELRRDSPESQHASTGSDKPVSRNVYESDSSNPCMLSPSSSGHLADSDTLSSGEEGAVPRVGEEEEGNMEAAADPGQAAGGQTSAAVTGGRKSRRSRSESEMPVNAMAAKKNRCQHTVAAVGGQEKQTNGKLAKVKGHRSQKHKERMRLLRQKREAAARKKYNLLQDSSTSDSELTCDSSTSSSEDEDDDTSGGSKTINTDIPAGFRRATERSRVGAQIHGLLDSGSWDRNSIGSVLEEAMTRFAVMQRQTEERFRIWMEKLARLDSDDDDSSKRSSDALEGRQHPTRGARPSPPSSFLPSSESAETMAAYMLARENTSLTPTPINNNNILPEVVTQNGNLGVPDPGLLNV